VAQNSTRRAPRATGPPRDQAGAPRE
jgi:hypothetical protein